jgi:hypothetical protein
MLIKVYQQQKRKENYQQLYLYIRTSNESKVQKRSLGVNNNIYIKKQLVDP